MGLFPPKGRLAFLDTTRETLKELDAIGRRTTEAGMTTLGKLTQQKVTAGTTQVALVPAGQLGAALGRLDGAEVGARFRLSGNNPGAVGLFLDKPDALKVVELLLGKNAGTVKRLGDVEESAVAEMTNIALNACLTALAAETGARFEGGVPDVEYKINDAAAFMGFDAPVGRHAAILMTPFHEPVRDARGTMVLVFAVPE